MAAMIILLFVSMLFLSGWYFSEKLINPIKVNRRKSFEIEVEKGYIIPDEYNSWEKEEVDINSVYGYNLSGLFFPIKNSNKGIILCHGITYTYYGTIKYIKFFREKGYNVLIYDHRAHGESGGKFTTFGYFEKYDLKQCFEWLKQKLGNRNIIGIHGESLGGAVAIQFGEIEKELSFIIADCAFSDLGDLLKYKLKNDYKIPVFPIYNIAEIITYVRAKFLFNWVSPKKSIENMSIPILFIHGEKDKFTPTEMSENMYKIKKDKKMICIVENAGHAESVAANYHKYWETVEEFLSDL